MADYKFTAAVEDFVQQTDKRMEALIKQTTLDVINDAQTPVAKGGRMRVDTGFLRYSGQLSLNGMPTGPVRGRDRKEGEVGALSEFSADRPIELELGKVKIGDTIFFGWTANYAAIRELYDGFLAGAIQKWPEIVRKRTEELRKRVMK